MVHAADASVDFIHLLITIVHMGAAVTRGPFLAMPALWAVGTLQQAAPAWALPDNFWSSDGEPITP